MQRPPANYSGPAEIWVSSYLWSNRFRTTSNSVDISILPPSFVLDRHYLSAIFAFGSSLSFGQYSRISNWAININLCRSFRTIQYRCIYVGQFLSTIPWNGALYLTAALGQYFLYGAVIIRIVIIVMAAFINWDSIFLPSNNLARYSTKRRIR